jgi:hypothetical protein
MNSKNALPAIISRLRARKANKLRCLSFKAAADEIAQALNINYDVALMTLFGLAATAKVRFLDDNGKVIEEDECTISQFEGRARYFVAEDVRHWIKELSSVPQTKQRDAEIKKRLPRRVPWKQFYKEIRDACNGWLPDGRPALGFGDKQIQRRVKDLTGE